MSNNKELEELKEYVTYCCSAKAIGEPFIDGQLFSGRCSDCKEISPLHEVDDEPTRYAEVDGKKPYYTQSEVDRLIREAVEKELKKAMEYARCLPDVGIRYPEDKEKYREFARASVVMTNYASTRLESLSKQKEE